MEGWFQIDLKEESRFETTERARVVNELVALFLIVSGLVALVVYYLCFHLLWVPLGLLFTWGFCFLAIRNFFVYLLPPPALRYLQKKTRTE